MGDHGEYWGDVRDHFRKKRERKALANAKQLPKWLKRIEATGAKCDRADHNRIRIHVAEDIIDFWPDTATYYAPQLDKRGEGIDDLIGFIDCRKHLVGADTVRAILQLPEGTVSYWAREFSEHFEGHRSKTRGRMFSPADLQTFCTIKRLLVYEMKSISDVKTWLADPRKAEVEA